MVLLKNTHQISKMKIWWIQVWVRPLGPLSKRRTMTNMIDSCVKDGVFRSHWYRSPAIALKKGRNNLIVKQIPYIEWTNSFLEQTCLDFIFEIILNQNDYIYKIRNNVISNGLARIKVTLKVFWKNLIRKSKKIILERSLELKWSFSVDRVVKPLLLLIMIMTIICLAFLFSS